MGVVCFYVLLEALDVLTGVLGWDILPKFLKTGIATRLIRRRQRRLDIAVNSSQPLNDRLFRFHLARSPSSSSKSLQRTASCGRC